MRTFAVVSLFLLLRSGAVLAGQGQIEIGPTTVFPIVISQPGSYLLTADLQAPSGSSAIEIAADDVSLDLGGHRVRGSGTASGAGIMVWDFYSGVRVRNGSMANFQVCLDLSGNNFSSGTVDSVSVSRCAIGMDVERTVVTNSTATFTSTAGVVAYQSVISSFVASFASSGTGISLSSSFCSGCTAASNIGRGFSLLSSTCTGCAATGNGQAGYGITGGGNLLTGCLATSNVGGSLEGSCTTSGNACFNNNLP